MKILFVDDDQSLVEVAKTILSHKGFEVETACSGEEALKIIEGFKPRVVILDMIMPGMGGLKTLEILNERYPQLKIIVLTAYDQDFRRNSQGLRYEAFLFKPVSLQELVKVINSLDKKDFSPPPEDKGTVSAKILIFETSPMLSNLLMVYLSSPQECGGYYFVNVLDREDLLLPLIEKNNPDVVLINISSLKYPQRILEEIEGLSRVELVLYGLTPEEREKLPDLHSKILAGLPQDSHFLDKLSLLLKERCHKLGLVL